MMVYERHHVKERKNTRATAAVHAYLCRVVGRALGLVVAVGSAAEAGTLVRWAAPEQCPTSADVDARVAHRVGSDRNVAPIEVTVHAGPAGFTAELGDTRTLSSASCDELANAVALIVARMVLEEPVAIEPPRVVVAAPIVIAPPSPPAWHVGARLSAASGLGAQPGLGIGGELAVPITWRDWFVEPAGALWKRSSADASGGAVDVALRTATLRIGARLPELPIRAWVAADLGELRGEGEQFMGDRSGAGGWFGLGVGASFAWYLGDRYAVVAGGEALAAVVRPTFELATGDVVYQPSAVAGRLTIGVEASWP
jgi:hypothetical protein